MSILVYETLNYNELKRWLVYSPRIAFLGGKDDVKSFGDGFSCFSFNCRYSVVFTSLHINTNGKIFVDGLFGRETH